MFLARLKSCPDAGIVPLQDCRGVQVALARRWDWEVLIVGAWLVSVEVGVFSTDRGEKDSELGRTSVRTKEFGVRNENRA